MDSSKQIKIKSLESAIHCIPEQGMQNFALFSKFNSSLISYLYYSYSSFSYWPLA